MEALYEEIARSIQIFGNFAGGRRHPTERESIDGDKSERSTRSQTWRLRGKHTSQKPVPIHPRVCEALVKWKEQSSYQQPEDWVFASRHSHGEQPYWGQAILHKYLRPAARELGIETRFGWHTFRHTYSTLLRSVGTEFKVMQELLRHSTIRSTLDVYTQAITPAKQNAQAAVMSLVFPSQRS